MKWARSEEEIWPAIFSPRGNGSGGACGQTVHTAHLTRGVIWQPGSGSATPSTFSSNTRTEIFFFFLVGRRYIILTQFFRKDLTLGQQLVIPGLAPSRYSRKHNKSHNINPLVHLILVQLKANGTRDTIPTCSSLQAP